MAMDPPSGFTRSGANPQRFRAGPSVQMNSWMSESFISRSAVAAPTLIKKLPLPMRRIIGDMSNRDRVLLGLDLVPAPGHSVAGKHS